MYCYNCMNDKGNAAVCPYCGVEQISQPAAHQLCPGTVLNGKYVVGRAIGEGGFGITYIGRDTNLDMRVAIKEFYPAGYTNRNSFAGADVEVGGGKQNDVFRKGKERFLKEARNVAKFSSEPGIVDVRDYFEENGTAYIIMEYLDGMDLNRYLNTYGNIPAQQAFKLMLPVMHSLKKINDAGIIHRDISPDNIMYLTDGTLELMDFGSARYFTQTETEMSVLLKQGYSPEEQYRRNGYQGPWTDVYGMCATLYRMITGEVPDSALDRLHEDTLRRPSERGVAISPGLEAVLMFGLAVYSENRCQSMAELIELTNRALNQDQELALHGMAIRPGANLYRPLDPNFHDYMKRDPAPKPAYPDYPANRGRQDGRSYGDNFTVADFHPEPEEEPEEKKSPLVPIIIIAAVALLVIVGAIVFFLIRNNSGKSSGSGAGDVTVAATVAPATQPDTTPTGTEAPKKVELIDVVGVKLDEAVNALQKRGYKVSVKPIASDKPANTVVEQSPKAGTPVEPGSEVILYIPEEKPTNPPTDPPTDPPTEDRTTYVNLCNGGAWFHKSDSRIAACYPEGIAFGDEVQYLNLTSGEFMKVRYHGNDGWVLKKYLVLKSQADGADTVYDREYYEPITCTVETTLYDGSDFRSGVTIRAEESAVQVGYCPSERSDSGRDYYEIYYKGKVYCLSFEILDSCFEYVRR